MPRCWIRRALGMCAIHFSDNMVQVLYIKTRQQYNEDGTTYGVWHQLWNAKCNQVFVHEGRNSTQYSCGDYTCVRWWHYVYLNGTIMGEEIPRGRMNRCSCHGQVNHWMLMRMRLQLHVLLLMAYLKEGGGMLLCIPGNPSQAPVSNSE